MRRIAVFAVLLLCFPICTMTAGTAAAFDAPEITPFPGQVDLYKTRSELLMDAANYTGVFTPEEAAVVWAEGLQGRSAAMQYTVMTESLKKEYAAQLDELNSSWVTGQSSPSIQRYKITKAVKPDNRHAEISLTFEEGYVYEPAPSAIYHATLWLVREGKFWRIGRIAPDKGLEGYTYYRPNK